MSVAGTTPAGRIIEEQLDTHLVEVEKQFSGDALAFVGPLYYGSDSAIRDAIEFIKTKHKSPGKTPSKSWPSMRPKVSVVLETQGGYAEVAERIARALHKHYDCVDFIVPDYAMSAGTILVMSGNEIWMDYFSLLGPIDPQVQGPRGNTVPAHGYLVQYNKLVEKSRKGKITTAELQFLVEKFDPAELHRYQQEMNLSVTLLKDWLVKYKFQHWDYTETRHRKVTMKMKRKRAELVANLLNDTTKWHSHNRGISMDTIRNDLLLTVNDFGAEPSKREAIRNYYKLLKDYMQKMSFPCVVHVRGNVAPMS